LLCPVLHAERLHEDSSWRAVRRLLEVVEKRDGRMTLFVSPFWPLVYDVDITSRLAEIAGRGHEIAQHTHYYDWDGQLPDRYRKRTELADANVVRCLDRDRDALCQSGFVPLGFSSGGWESPAALPPWLASHGFAYDCSRRAYVAGDPSRASGAVLDIPTTHSLKSALRDVVLGRLAGQRVGSANVAVYYAHDYDLVSATRRLAATAVARWPRHGRRCVRVDEVVGGVISPPPQRPSPQ